MATIRRSIKTSAKDHGWAVTDAQLDDRHIVRRMILKKTIFGVDKNPMAVELAKTALWLHTFTRIYFSDEAGANANDAVLQSVPADRRGTLIAERVAQDGAVRYRFDIRMQGDGETVFFDV